ncbi:MAG TPA: hypothetical protein VJH55_02050 [Candidatus Paceibacterota bacterium]
MPASHLVPATTLTDGLEYFEFTYSYAYKERSISSGYAEDIPGKEGYVWEESKFVPVLCEAPRTWLPKK